MNYPPKKFKIAITVILFAMFPFGVFAQTGNQDCSSIGYTIATINGVLTNEDGAIKNRDKLKDKLPETHNGEKLTIEYLLNPIHAGGFGDLLNSVVQKAFENEVVADYDLIEMLNDASKKVKTQKLLLVAHSQGNFYANSFYDVVTEKQTGSVPSQSIGVYGIANPASRVAGNGKWLTSDTDKVINWVVGNVPFRKIKTPNAHIVLQPNDDFMGHDLALVYIPHEGAQITKDINVSLDNLSKNTIQNENAPCITPPEITPAHIKQGIAYAVTDPILNPIGAGTLWTLGKGIGGAVFAYNTGVDVTVGTYHLAVNTAVWTFNTSVAVAMWSYDTTVAVAKLVGNGVMAAGAFVYNAVATTLPGAVVANNGAAVILSTQNAQNPQNIAPTVDSKIIVPNPILKNPVSTTLTQKTPANQPIVFNLTAKPSGGQNNSNMPKLVFVGTFNTGSGKTAPPSSQVLGIQTTTPSSDETKSEGEQVKGLTQAGAALSAPVLSLPQCAQTLATDGCLLATTTVRFEWSQVEGADHYVINKNGTVATTTDITIEIVAQDFSEYTFEVVAVDSDGNKSATSTQKISVATIPVAINEIAWMGTVASPNDEWFELKNNTAHTIDLSQWELNAKDGTPHVKLKGTMAPHAYLVFERTDDTTITDVDAHQIYTGALGNTGEQLNLSYASTTFDQTPDGAWAAGYNSTTTRKTMERYSSRESGADPANWGTSLGDTRTEKEVNDCYAKALKSWGNLEICFNEGYALNGKDANGNPIVGTPGARNSVSYLINKGQDIINTDFTLTPEDGYYISSGNLVDASSTLTISPGVEIRFNKEYIALDVEGRLVIIGTPENPVIINGFPETKYIRTKGGIEINGEAASAVIQNARIQNTEGIAVDGGATLDVFNTEFFANDDPIAVYDGSVTISSSTIRSMGNPPRAALSVFGGSFLDVSSTTIDLDNGGDGVNVYDDSMLVISNSVIRDIKRSGIGIYESTADISNVTIENTGEDGIGVYDGAVSIASTTIRNTGRDGIGLFDSTSTISNTTMEGGKNDGIAIYGGTATIASTTVSGYTKNKCYPYGDGITTWCDMGAGILVDEPIEPVIVTGGEVTGNSEGVYVDNPDSVIFNDVSIHNNGEDIVVAPTY